MCTVSVIALQNGFRLVSSRDEQRSRPASAAPAWRTLATNRGTAVPGEPGPRAIWPADLLRSGAEGGTWIGASERGLAMTVLNLNLTPPPRLPDGLRSRGDLIPALLHLSSPHAVAAALHEMDLTPYAPFRLIAAERPTPEELPVVAEIRWDRLAISSAWHRPPVCFASSGLGDELVRVRLPLFESMVGAGPADPETQDAFHAHAWPDRRPVSVLMSRAEARTVSVTSVAVVRDGWSGRAAVTMNYRPIAEDARDAAMTPAERTASG